MHALVRYVMSVQQEATEVVEANAPVASVADIAVIVGVFLTAIGLFFAAYRVKLLSDQLKLAREGEITARSYDFIARWNDPTFDRYRTGVATFFRTDSRTPDEIGLERQRDPEFRGALSLVVNFLEELGIAWDRKAVDQAIVFAFFGGIVMGYRNWLGGFVDHHRKTLGEDNKTLPSRAIRRIWTSYEKMCRDMEERWDELCAKASG